MSLIVKNSGGGDFQLPPAGNHRARCYRVIDLGTQTVTWQGAEKHQPKVLIGWELTDEPMEDGRPFTVSARFTASLSEKANLRHVLESWRGKKFTEQELEGFQLSKLLTVACLVTVAHEKSKDGTKTYANVKAVTPLPKAMNAPDPLKNEPVFYEIEQGKNATFQALPEWLQNVICQCKEWTTPTEQDSDGPRAPRDEDEPPVEDDGDSIPF
jgi:hypothetical protein